jgi:hypothetical protein
MLEILLSGLEILCLMQGFLKIAPQLRQFLFSQRGNLLALPGPGLRELIVLLFDALLQDFLSLFQVSLLRDAPRQDSEQDNDNPSHSTPRLPLKLQPHVV